MAEKIEGLSIGLDLDTVGIDNSLKQLKGKIGLVDSEMRANLSTFDRSEKSMKKYETQLTGLNKRLDVQKAAVKASKEEYDKMVERHGKSSAQAEKAATVYNKQVATFQSLERRVGSLSDEMKQFEKQQEIASSGWTKMSNKMEDASGKISAIGGKLQGVGAGLTAGLTAPITAFGVASTKSALDFDQAQGKMQAQLGLTKEEANQLGDVAQKVWKNNFGEDIGEATEAVAGIRQMMGDLSEEELQAVAEGAFTIRDAFGAEIQETTRTASVLMKNFGIDGEEALDLITTGFQRGGDFSGELLDTLREYAPQFEGMGYDAEEFTAILIAGAETGAFNLDKVGDAAKEAFLRIGDGSKASRDSLENLGLNFEQIEDGINSGGDAAKSSFAAVVSAIATVEDPAERAQTAVALLGTPLEDLGPEFQTFFTDVNTDLGDFEGATGRAGEALYDNLGSRASQAFREFQEDLLPTGEVLMDLAEDILPKVADSVAGVTGWFSELDEDGQKVAIALGGMAAVAGPLALVGAQLATGLAGVLSVVGPLTGMIAGAGGLTASLGTAGGAIAAFATGPVGLGIAAIAGLTIGGIAFAKHMSEDAIPEVDRFGDQISETTQESLGKFFELSDGVGDAMAEMSILSQEVTDEMAESITGKFASMNEQILEGMKLRQEEQLETMQTFFAASSTLTEEEEAAILKRQGWYNDMEVAGQEAKEARVKEIMDAASKEKRELTETERIEINGIRTSMNNEAVEQLSANEVEQQIIMQRMKDSAGELSARQAADVVARATEQKDGAITAAEEQYEGTLEEIIRMRDESGTISAEQATKLIAEAKKTRDESVGHAESMHADVITEAKAQAGEHVDEVDWSTGEILSNWDIYKKGVLKRFRETNESSMEDFKRWGGNISEAAGNVKDDMLDGWEKYKTGINTMFRGAAQNALNRTGDLVNGVIKGINWALDKLDMKKLGYWNVPNVLGRSGAGSSSGAPVRAYAFGTDAHPGGYALVGDGKGDNAGPEYIRTPDGKHGFSPASNTLMDLPKGTTVLSAKETRALFGPIPKYANGIGGIASHLWESGKDLWNSGKEKAFDIFDYLTNPKKLLDIGLAAVGFKMPTMGGFMKDALSGGLNKLKDGAIDYLKNAFGDFGGSGGAGFGPAFRKTSSYGFRIHPILKTAKMHAGDDYGAPVGTPIPAQAGGRVSIAGFHPIRGNYVRINSGALERIYQHNQRNLVKTGDMVKQGQYVGTVGSTGRSTGPHLHYEVLRNGRNINPKGLATGGITNGFMVSSLHEEGYPEFVIPTAPNRRTDAMKLLALAYKQIGGGDKATRPNQLPNVTQGTATDALLQAVTKSNEFLMKQNEILMQLLGKDSNLYVDGDVMAGTLAPRIETINNDRNAMRDSGRHGRRY